MHIEAALAGVPKEERCKCRDQDDKVCKFLLLDYH
jgi:hypothetical protein